MREQDPRSTVPHGEAPLERLARSFALHLARAVRVHRQSPEGSVVRQQQLGTAFRALSELLAAVPAAKFAAFAEGLSFDGKVVLSDQEEQGASNLFLTPEVTLTFFAGVSGAELVQLVRLLAGEVDDRPRFGEDLATLLWRHELSHIVASPAGTATRQHELELDALFQTLAIDPRTGINTARLADRALDRQEVWEQAIASSQEWSAAVIAALEQRQGLETIEAFRDSVERARTPVQVQLDLAETVIEAVLAGATQTIGRVELELVLAIQAVLIEGRAFNAAARLVHRVRTATRSPKDSERNAARSLLATLAVRPAVTASVTSLDHIEDPRDADPILDFLRALGTEALGPLFEAAEGVERASSREILANLLIDLTRDRRLDLAATITRGHGELATQILKAARKLKSDEVAELCFPGLVHFSATVRAQALRLLAPFARGVPDQLVARSLLDPDENVRLVAAKVAVQRRSDLGEQQLAQLIQRDDFLDRNPQEVRAFLGAFASLARDRALSVLGPLFLGAGALTSRHKASATEAIAASIGEIGTPQARRLLTKAAQALNPKLRGAARTALQAMAQAPVPSIPPATTTSPGLDALIAAFAQPTGDIDPSAAAPPAKDPRPPWPEALTLDALPKVPLGLRTSIPPASSSPFSISSTSGRTSTSPPSTQVPLTSATSFPGRGTFPPPGTKSPRISGSPAPPHPPPAATDPGILAQPLLAADPPPPLTAPLYELGARRSRPPPVSGSPTRSSRPVEPADSPARKGRTSQPPQLPPEALTVLNDEDDPT